MNSIDGIGRVTGRQTARHRLPWLLRAVLLLALLYAGGLVVFVRTLPPAAGPQTPAARADAIVALTGENRRLSAAVRLLEAGAGRRLLITGVNPATNKSTLKDYTGGETAFDCCADLGFEATDTRGNAREASAWAAAHGYRSLIVVTGSDHMPRSLMEFASEMPEVVLIPYAVVPQSEDLPFLERLAALNGEFAKFLASSVRVSLTPARAGS